MFNETIQTYLDNPYVKYVLIALALIGGVVVACHGKKILNFFKFLICAGAGFYAGYAVVYPLVATYLTFNYAQLVVGAVLAVVAAILCKILYPIAFAAAFGYAAYLAIPVVAAQVSQLAVLNNPTYLLIAAIVVGVIVLIFRGLVEMLGTAVAGGYAFAWGLENLILVILAFTGKTYVSVFTPITVAIFTAVIALIGFVKQVKNRHRF